MTTKEDMSDDLSGYNPWLVNLALSYHPDLILIANAINTMYDLDSRTQYKYLFNIVRKSRRPFNKWSKNETNEWIDTISAAYGVNKRVAKEYAKILTKEQVAYLQSLFVEGGI